MWYYTIPGSKNLDPDLFSFYLGIWIPILLSKCLMNIWPRCFKFVIRISVVLNCFSQFSFIQVLWLLFASMFLFVCRTYCSLAGSIWFLLTVYLPYLVYIFQIVEDFQKFFPLFIGVCVTLFSIWCTILMKLLWQRNWSIYDITTSIAYMSHFVHLQTTYTEKDYWIFNYKCLVMNIATEFAKYFSA